MDHDRDSKDDVYVGFCTLYQQAVTRFKYNQKCRNRRRGKQCKQFTRHIPEWRKDYNRNPNNRRHRR